MAPDGEPAPAADQNPAMQRLMQSVLLLGMGSSLAYAIGNVLRGSAVRSWNEPILGALIGAASGLALQVAVQRRQDAARVPHARGQPQRHGAVRHDRRDHHLGADVRDRRHALHTAVRRHAGDLCTPILVFPLSHLLFRNQDKIMRHTLPAAA